MIIHHWIGYHGKMEIISRWTTAYLASGQAHQLPSSVKTAQVFIAIKTKYSPRRAYDAQGYY